MPPPILHVQIDTREKYPVPFPSSISLGHLGARRIHVIETSRVKLDTADYRLADYPDLVGIERKYGAREVWDCSCGKSHDMFRSQLDRLATEFRLPYLLIEDPPTRSMPPPSCVRTRGEPSRSQSRNVCPEELRSGLFRTTLGADVWQSEGPSSPSSTRELFNGRT